MASPGYAYRVGGTVGGPEANVTAEAQVQGGPGRVGYSERGGVRLGRYYAERHQGVEVSERDVKYGSGQSGGVAGVYGYREEHDRSVGLGGLARSDTVAVNVLGVGASEARKTSLDKEGLSGETEVKVGGFEYKETGRIDAKGTVQYGIKAGDADCECSCNPFELIAACCGGLFELVFGCCDE